MLQFLLFLLALVPAAHADAPAKSTVLEKARSTINGELSVVDVSGFRFLIARANQGIQIHGSLDLQNHARLVTPYTQIVSLITALHPSVEQAFDMGLGGGTLSRFQLTHYPKTQVDSVEIDPAAINLAKKYFFVSEDRHKILEGDGFETLQAQNKKYDVIWMDEFTPKAGPRVMIEAEYQKILRDHLKPDGILVVHLGTASSSKTFARTITDYETGFTHGIRVQGPESLSDELAKLRVTALTLTQKKSETPKYNPDQVVAFTNGTSLTCAHFWETYRKWADEKLIDLKWPAASQAQSCEELHP